MELKDPTRYQDVAVPVEGADDEGLYMIYEGGEFRKRVELHFV